MNEEENNELFKTVDLNLAVFLVAKDEKLMDILNHSRRKTFVFTLTSQLKDLVELFNFADKDDEGMLLDARKVMRTERELKTKLFNIL